MSSNGLILLIDHHALTRHGIATLLNRNLAEFDVEGVATIAEAAAYATAPIRAVLWKPESGAAEIPAMVSRIKAIGGAIGSAPLMVVVHHQTQGFPADVLNLGISGCVSPAVGAQDLATAIRLIMNGGLLIGPGILRDVSATAIRFPAADNGLALTRRENEVLTHLRQGKPNKVIAHELHISESTVKVHVSRILRKRHAANRTEAAGVDEDGDATQGNATGAAFRFALL